ncbi:MAG: hypothetical protein P8L36_04630 [SAR324 cluster bacterium]|nr:hypothetical protein [SAR324 cluster bacterium]
MPAQSRTEVGCRKIAVLSLQIEYSIATSAQSDYYPYIKLV